MIGPRLAVLGALSLAAPSALGLTMEEALIHAAQSNPTVQAAHKAARAHHEEVPLARSAWLPTVQANMTASRTRTGSVERFVPGPPSFIDLPVHTSRTDRTETGNVVPFPVPGTPNRQVVSDSSGRDSLELVLTQNLFRSGRDSANLRQAEAGVQLVHARVEDTEQNVLLLAATAYLDVLRAERVVGLREASLAAFNARARETTAQFQVGDRTMADVAQSDAEREVAAAELASAKADLGSQQARFEMLVGLPADDLEPAVEPTGLPETLAAALQTAQVQRPSVRVAWHAVRAARHAVRAAKGELGPSVDLRAALTRNMSHGTSLPNSTDRSIGIQLSMPLYLGGASGARLRQAQRQLAQRQDELLAEQREAAQRAVSAWRNLNAARQRHAALATAVTASRLALDGIRREAGIGERTTREVLDAERDLISFQVRELSAQRDAIVGAYTLLAATGGLTAREIGVEGVPDLDREALETRENFAPGILMLFDRPE